MHSARRSHEVIASLEGHGGLTIELKSKRPLEDVAHLLARMRVPPRSAASLELDDDLDRFPRPCRQIGPLELRPLERRLLRRAEPHDPDPESHRRNAYA